MKWILLVYDNRNGDLSIESFDEKQRAFPALDRREAIKAEHEEVVLFLARSVNDLRDTHPRFFPPDQVTSDPAMAV